MSAQRQKTIIFVCPCDSPVGGRDTPTVPESHGLFFNFIPRSQLGLFNEIDKLVAVQREDLDLNDPTGEARGPGHLTEDRRP